MAVWARWGADVGAGLARTTTELGATASTAGKLVHNTYTVEGRIEQTARFARGVRRARGRNRVAGYVMFAILAAPIPVSLVLRVLLVVR